MGVKSEFNDIKKNHAADPEIQLKNYFKVSWSRNGHAVSVGAKMTMKKLTFANPIPITSGQRFLRVPFIYFEFQMHAPLFSSTRVKFSYFAWTSSTIFSNASDRF